MCALEQMAVPEGAAEEYLSVRREIERREELYEANCTSVQLGAAIDWCLQVIAERRISELVPLLADGQEQSELPSDLRLNPRHPFFKEIVLKMDPLAPDSGEIKMAVFLPGRAIPLDWLESELPDLYAGGTDPDAGALHFEVLRLVNDRSGRIEFVCEQVEEDRRPLIGKFVVWCW